MEQDITGTEHLIKNITDVLPTEIHLSLISHSPYFSITPQNLTHEKYIIARVWVCMKLECGEAEDLKAEVNRGLRNCRHPKPKCV